MDARVERQGIRQREFPAPAGFVLEESVLHRPIGGPEAMHKQLPALKSSPE